jgi:hypothetical protein
MDVLGLYKWKIRERERLILGEGVEDDNYAIVLRTHLPSDLQLSLESPRPLFSTRRRPRTQSSSYA